ncbi:MAG TPA: hypothetical protein VI759_02875 [Dehalococcoidia bacterium]|nr:hypothetical protein [Dehalococcoidia bacterium]
MDVEFLMLADGAEAVNGKVYVLGGGWNNIGVAAFPAEHRMSVVVGLGVGWNETSERHNLVLNIFTADGDLFMEVAKAQFEMGRPAGLKAGESQRLMMAANCVLKAEKPEELQVVLAVDGSDVRSIPFKVTKVMGAPQAI